MSEPIIEIKNISKVYNIGHEQSATPGNMTFRDTLVGMARKPLELVTGHKLEKEKFWALSDVSFDVNKGDVVGIVGRNGSGKSTLLKVLSRIVDPTEGEVRMRGKAASLLEVGTGFHPELTGRENVFFNGAILGMSQKEIKAKFDEIVAFSEVEKFLDTPVKFYSSGMYVRLAFAVAAHLEPDILIVDEVLAVGDAAFQKKCLGKMSEVAGEGRTVLFVSHSMPAVKSLCNKGVYLENGKIVASGNMEEVADAYMNQTHGSAPTGDLSDRPRFKGLSQEARLKKIRINDAKDDAIVQLDSKKPLSLEFTIHAPAAIESPVAMHVVLQDSSGVALRLHSEHTNELFTLKKGDNTIVCKIDPTHLLGGAYTLDCSVLFPGREPHHIDSIESAYILHIEDYKTPGGQLLTQRDAKYYVNQHWSQS